VNLLTILPMAIVMVAGPQMVSAVFLATSDTWRRSSVAYLAGAATAITAGTAIAYGAARLLKGSLDGDRDGSGNSLLDVVIVVLLLVLTVVVFVRRKDTKPPRWMGQLQHATPGFAYKLGLLLFLLMPTDIITMLSVGSHLARGGSPWWQVVPFLLLTLLLVGLPALIVVLLGRRALAVLPKVRDWMSANSWVVSEIVIVFFLVVTIA
jgi:Sap, sulfolipid-1-addressing protein